MLINILQHRTFEKDISLEDSFLFVQIRFMLDDAGDRPGGASATCVLSEDSPVNFHAWADKDHDIRLRRAFLRCQNGQGPEKEKGSEKNGHGQDDDLSSLHEIVPLHDG
jgi:hypothetical protein